MHPELLHPNPVRLRRPAAMPPEAGARASTDLASCLPADWIRDGGLRVFRADAGYLGRSIAALKLYLTLVVSQDECPDEPAPILMTYGRIAALSGLSDPLICAGKKALLDQGLVAVDGERPGGTIAYRLTGLSPAATARILHAPRAEPRIAALHGLTCRKAQNLAALKTYLLMSARGSGPDGVVSVDVDAAAELSGVSHVRIEAALAALQDLGLAETLPSPRSCRAASAADQRRVRLLPLR